MKYNSSAPVIKKQERVMYKFTKNLTSSQVFFKEFERNFRIAILRKNILMAASEDNYILRTFLNGYFSKGAVKKLKVKTF